MTAEILIARELEPLIPPDWLANHNIRWLEREYPVPNCSAVALIPVLNRKIGSAEFDRLPDLKIVAASAVGVDNIDLAQARRRGIVVTNTPDVLTESTADLTWTLILGTARRVREGIDLVRSAQWKGWHPTLLLGMELNTRTLGIIGAGRIGQAVGRRAPGFGMRVAYASRTPKPEFERAVGATRLPLDRLIAECDVVSLHAPLTDETRNLLNADRIASMKKGAILINTARGGMVDEMALVRALDDGHLSAAGLDVFEGEPSVSLPVSQHPSIFCLPHLGSATWETRRAMATLAARNVSAVLAGEPPLTPVIE
jgi:glyoxylate reductase